MNAQKEFSARWEKPLTYVFGVVLLALIAIELSSLFIVPIVDSYRWWGDESWLMTEYKTQIATGIFCHPFAHGATIEHSSGLIFSNMWVTSLLYGLPANIFSGWDIVYVGRFVTSILAFVLVFVMFMFFKRKQVQPVYTIAALLLLVSTRGFLFMSHSARYDILTSLALIGYGILFSRIIAKKKEGLLKCDTRFYFLLALCWSASLLISVHALILTAVPFLYTLIKLKFYKSFKTWMALAAGGLMFLGAIVLIFSVTTGGVSIFGAGQSQGSSFMANVYQIPLLRPFSRSVQLSNIQQRIDLFKDLAHNYMWMSVLVLMLYGISRLWRKKLPVNSGLSTTSQEIIILSILIFVSWCLLENVAPTSYIIYVLPILSISLILELQKVIRIFPQAVQISLVIIILGALSFTGLHDALRAREVGLEMRNFKLHQTEPQNIALQPHS